MCCGRIPRVTPGLSLVFNFLGSLCTLSKVTAVILAKWATFREDLVVIKHYIKDSIIWFDYDNDVNAIKLLYAFMQTLIHICFSKS